MPANMMTNPGGSVRPLSSMPNTHRQSTLSAISTRIHDLTAQVQHVKIEGQRMRDLVKSAPGAGQSRLDWIHNQLNSI